MPALWRSGVSLLLLDRLALVKPAKCGFVQALSQQI